MCTGMTCPVVSPPLNGQVSGDGNKYGDTITYSCSQGYKLKGQATQQCQADGTWSGKKPSCESESP